jgi:hypothetical protein
MAKVICNIALKGNCKSVSKRNCPHSKPHRVRSTGSANSTYCREPEILYCYSLRINAKKIKTQCVPA